MRRFCRLWYYFQSRTTELGYRHSLQGRRTRQIGAGTVEIVTQANKKGGYDRRWIFVTSKPSSREIKQSLRQQGQAIFWMAC
jgi:hypothetical protein